MYAALMEEPVAAAKPSAASAAPSAKPANKPVVGGIKKSEAPNRSSSPASSLPVSQGRLPGEIRKDTNRGPRKQHQPRTEQGGRIRGREYDRHSGTGRPVTENKRGGAGRNNWGSVKDGTRAQRDEEAAAEVAAAVVSTEAEATGETATPVEVAADAGAESPKADAPQEPKLLSLSAWKAEKAKKQKELEALVGAAPAPAREIKPEWYKPEEKSTASSSSSKASSSAPKEQKQVKKVLPLSQVIGEKHQPREDRGPRGPRRDREGSGEFRQPREGGNFRAGGSRHQGGQRSQGKGKQRPTFDATAVSDLPAL